LNPDEFSGRDRRYASVAVGLVLAVAAWTRWPLLREGLWADESLTVYLAQSKSLRELVARCRIADYSPPLFHLLLGGWGRIFGFGEVAVKSLVLAMGLGAVAAAALAAGEAFGGVAAVVAASLLANNRLMIEMSAEVRPYALSAMLAGVAAFGLFRLRRRIVQGRSARTARIGATVAFILLGYSHYAGMFAVAIIGAVALAFSLVGPERLFARRAAGCALVAGATFLPWLPIFLYQRRVGLPWAPGLTNELRWTRLGGKVSDFFPIVGDDRMSGAWLGVAILAGIFLASPESRAELRKRSTSLTFLAALALLGFVFVGYAIPAPRYLTVGTAFTCLFLAGLLGWPTAVAGGRRRQAAWLGVGLVVVGSYLGRLWQYGQIREREANGLPKTGVRTAVQKNHFGPDDILIAVPDTLSQSLWYYTKSGALIRGFARWTDPVLPDYGRYDSDWFDPAAIPNAWAALEKDVADRDAKRVVLFFAVGEYNPSFGCARDFRDFLLSRMKRLKSQSYAASVEGVQMTIFEAPKE